MCEQCLEDNGKFCPKNLFYKGKVKKDGQERDGILYNFNEVDKCQGCLKCEPSCPEGAIKPVVFDGKSFS
jgi:NAD-dependent dihydropyrimidine dehydrogenase PreA subunit